nr:hypothetical protein [Tanacetum cinerariifolium]
PIMLDAFKSAMCVEAWGQIGFARALIKVSVDKDLKQEVIMAILNVEDDGMTHTMVAIRVEYEWKPPLCMDYHVFGHSTEQCPKHILEKTIPIPEVPDDGFTTVTKRKSKGKSGVYNQKGAATGFKINPPKKNFIYQPVQKIFVDPKASAQKVGESSNGVKLNNMFEKLNEITTIVPESEEMGKDTMVRESAVNNKHNDDSDIRLRRYILKSILIQLNRRGQSKVRQVVNENQLSDFNVALNMEDTFSCSSAMNGVMCEFKDCVADIELPNLTVPKPEPFKFLNFLADKSKFSELLDYHWKSHVDGHKMFKVVSKMKLIKKPLRKLLHEQEGLHETVNKLRIEFNTVQKALDSDPANATLKEQECAYV